MNAPSMHKSSTSFPWTPPAMTCRQRRRSSSLKNSNRHSSIVGLLVRIEVAWRAPARCPGRASQTPRGAARRNGRTSPGRNRFVGSITTLSHGEPISSSSFRALITELTTL